MVADNQIFPGTEYTFGQVRRMCRKNKALFSMLFFPHHVIPSIGVPDFHKEIDAAFEDRSQQYTLILAPRGFAKSTRSFVDTMHDIAYKLEEFIILASKTNDLAKQYIFKVKYELEANQLFIAAYGDMAPRSRAQSTWTKNDIICRNGIRVRSIGAGNQIRGINYGPFRPSKIVLDDPEDIRSVDSAEERENIRQWFNHDVCYCVSQGAVGGQQRGRIIVIGNMIHSDCLVARLQEDSRFHVIYYQAIIQEKGQERSLWPEYFPLEDLLKEKRESIERGEHHIFMMERMNVSMSPEERLVREVDLREWDGRYVHNEGMSAVEWNDFVIPVEVVTSVDLASSEKRHSDFTVIGTTGMDAKQNLYIIDYWKHRESNPVHILVKLLLHIGKFHPSFLVIESISFQETFSKFFMYLRNDKGKLKKLLEMEEVSDEDILLIMNAWLPPVIEVKPTTNKPKRLKSLQPPFRIHQIYHKPWMKDFVREALDCPEGKHDDIIDMVQMCHAHSHGASIERVEHKKPEVPVDAFMMRDGSPIRYTDRLPVRRNAWTL